MDLCLRGARYEGEKVELYTYISLSLYDGEWSDLHAGRFTAEGRQAGRVVEDPPV